MTFKLELIDTNISELKGKSDSVSFNYDHISFPAQSQFKVSKIKLSSALGVTEIDSDKYKTTARINFPNDLYIAFKCSTDAYLKQIKHHRFTKNDSFEVTEHFSGLTLVGGGFAVLLLFSALSGGNQNGTSQNSSNGGGSGVSAESARAVQKVIRLYGFKCDSVDSVIESSWDGSFSVSCNNYYYRYSIDDVGGNWVVTVK